MRKKPSMYLRITAKIWSAANTTHSGKHMTSLKCGSSPIIRPERQRGGPRIRIAASPGSDDGPSICLEENVAGG